MYYDVRFYVPECEELHSIFDDGELYKISQKNFEKFDKNGRRLKLDCFCGKRVIGITDEELWYDKDEKYIIDIWRNACYAE